MALTGIGRTTAALMALGILQASQTVAASAQPAGSQWYNCNGYANFVCNNYGAELGYYNYVECFNIVKTHCEQGYYYEDIIGGGVTSPKQEKLLIRERHRG